MRPVEALGKIDGEKVFLDSAEDFSLSSAVDCRIGSLEIRLDIEIEYRFVDCRIGSLEILDENGKKDFKVDCRIGSLENAIPHFGLLTIVDCRIGSLENRDG